jgi:K+-transporting ATPase ATPase B chain
VTEQALADAAQLASLADETPEGRSIVVLAKQKFNLRERDRPVTRRASCRSPRRRA